METTSNPFHNEREGATDSAATPEKHISKEHPPTKISLLQLTTDYFIPSKDAPPLQLFIFLNEMPMQLQIPLLTERI